MGDCYRATGEPGVAGSQRLPFSARGLPQKNFDNRPVPTAFEKEVAGMGENGVDDCGTVILLLMAATVSHK